MPSPAPRTYFNTQLMDPRLRRLFDIGVEDLQSVGGAAWRDPEELMAIAERQTKELNAVGMGHEASPHQLRDAISRVTGLPSGEWVD